MYGNRKYHPEWGNLITKEHTLYALTDKWILAQNLGIPNIQFTDHMKLKKKEDQSIGASVLFRKGTKISMRANMDTQCGAETEGKTIQRLPQLRIHHIYSHQTQTLLWMQTSACWQEPDVTVSLEDLPVPDKYQRLALSQPLDWAQGPQWRS